MYTKKALFDRTKYMTGDPIPFMGAEKKTDKEATRSAFKGKQPAVVYPKQVAAAQEGLFSKQTYASEPFDDASGTLKDYPLDKRRLGFYHRAPGRGLCAKTVDMERYRAHVKTEYKHIDEKLEASLTRADAEKAASPSALTMTASRVHTTFEKEGKDMKEGRPKTLYDYVHSDQTRDDWQKTSRDVWYHMHARPADERKRAGPLTTVSDDYGYGIDGIEKTPQHGKHSAWRDFLDKGHKEADLSHF